MDSFTFTLVSTQTAKEDIRIESSEPVDYDNGGGGSSGCVIA